MGGYYTPVMSAVFRCDILTRTKRKLLIDSEPSDGLVAALKLGPKSTDTEIYDTANRWWGKLGHDDEPLGFAGVTTPRTQMEIPQASRKPIQN